MPELTQNASPIVQLDRIWKSFAGVEVLTDVSLSVQKGEVVCIIGPSGAGKSTLLRCINHLEAIDDGTVYFEGVPVYRYKRDGKVITDPERRVEQIRSQIGMVFQAFNLFPHLTVLGNVMEAPVHVLGLKPEAARARALTVLRKVAPGQARQCLSSSAQRRPAAACGDCPGAGDGAEGDAVRRSHLGAPTRSWWAKC